MVIKKLVEHKFELKFQIKFVLFIRKKDRFTEYF